MEQLCETYPKESILFLRRAIVTTLITGLILTTPVIICLLTNESSDSSLALRFWSLLRISLFVLQLPLRYSVWKKLNECNNAAVREREQALLVDVLHSRSWKLTQIGSFIVSMWVIITILYTAVLHRIYLMQYPDYPDYPVYYFCFAGYISMCLLRWSYVSLFIFLSHLVFIIYWLRNLMLVKLIRQQTQGHSCYFRVDHTADSQICSICKCDDEENELTIFIQLNECSHQFHMKCIEEWFQTKQQKLCPLCLRNYDVTTSSPPPPPPSLPTVHSHYARHEANSASSLRLRQAFLLRNYASSSSPSASREAMHLLLHSHSSRTNNSLFYFMPN